MKNYYEVLEVKQDASQVEIEQAYKSIIARYNPNNYTGEARSIVEKRLQEVKEAYSILSDNFLRDQYNKEIGIKQEKQYNQEQENPEQTNTNTKSNRRIRKT